MNLSNLTISSRLIILISALLAMPVTIGGIGLFGISQTDDALKRVCEARMPPLGQVAEIQRPLLRSRLAVANTLLDPTLEVIAQNTAEIDANLPAIDNIWDAFMATHLTADEAHIAKKFSQDRALFSQEGLLPAVAALRANDTAQAHQLTKERIRPLYDTVASGIDALIKLQLVVAKQEFDAATVMYNNIRLLSISAIVKQKADHAHEANQLAHEASSTALQGGGVVADVVASEVRNLAGRSAGAAKNIKSVISASNERVEEVTALVDSAGITMNEVVIGIRRVTYLMGGISADSREQSQGVSQMDQVTQQDAALVEEIAAAASSLKAQAQGLLGTVAVFKLGGHEPKQLMEQHDQMTRQNAAV